MRWGNLDIGNALWTLSREQTKSDRLHEVPLSSLALEIIESVPRTGEHVFTTNGKTPISGFSNRKPLLTTWRRRPARRMRSTHRLMHGYDRTR